MTNHWLVKQHNVTQKLKLSVLERAENIVGIGENEYWLQAYLFSNNVFKIFLLRIAKSLDYMVNAFLPKQQNFWLFKIQSTCRWLNKCDSKFCFRKGRKHFGKRRKCWLPAFFPFLKMFSKDLFLKGCLTTQWHLLTPLGNKPFENTVGKGEIARNEQLLLFPQCFLPVWITFCRSRQMWNCCLQTFLVWKSLKFVVW